MTRKIRILQPEAIERLKRDLKKAETDWDFLSSIGGRGAVAEFEEKFSMVVDGKYAIALNNATCAIFTALMASGVNQGDEVILPSYTWPQTLTPVIMTGATPVFADIEEDTVTISSESVERLISKKTKAIIGVHLFGYPADVEALGKIAKKHKCTLIYDAAQGFGATVNNKGMGAYGDFTAFSFGRSKLFSVGEGGALICRTRRLYEKAVAFSQHQLRSHRDIDNKRLRDSIDGVSMNFRMHPLVASLAIGQLEGLLAGDKCMRLHNQLERGYSVMMDNGLDHLLPRIFEGASPSGITIPLTGVSEDGILKCHEALKGVGELLQGSPLTPLHLTKAVRRHRLLWGQKIHDHPTHERGSCPNTEKRYETNQYVINKI